MQVLAAMRAPLILPLLLAACSAGVPDRSAESNAAVGEGSEPAPVPSASSAVTDVPPPADALPTEDAGNFAAPTPSASPLEEGPEQSPQAAAALVRQYYRLIGTDHADAAWGMWDNDGRASGQSRDAFVQGFARYSRLIAEVGRPGRVEAGAGQRYVEIPVTLKGALQSGEPVTMKGIVALHRAGPVDGATPEQRRWRIVRADIGPGPIEPTATASASASPTPAEARYRCDDGVQLTVRFDRTDDSADVELGGELLGKLEGQKAASGIWYKRGETELRGKGEEATVTRPGAAELHCSMKG